MIQIKINISFMTASLTNQNWIRRWCRRKCASSRWGACDLQVQGRIVGTQGAADAKACIGIDCYKKKRGIKASTSWIEWSITTSRRSLHPRAISPTRSPGRDQHTLNKSRMTQMGKIFNWYNIWKKGRMEYVFFRRAGRPGTAVLRRELKRKIRKRAITADVNILRQQFIWRNNSNKVMRDLNVLTNGPHTRGLNNTPQLRRYHSFAALRHSDA